MSGSFAHEVMNAGGGDVGACFYCGTCVASCPGAKVTSYRIRKIIRDIAMGFKEKVLSSDDIWRCTTCFTCHERCPRNVNPTEVVIALRNLAVRNGYIPENFKKALANLRSLGYIVPLSKDVADAREKLGLKPIGMHGKDLKEVRKILKIAGL